VGKHPARLRAKTAVDVSWEAFNELPVAAVNVFLLRVVPDTAGEPQEVVVEVGFLPPLPVYGTPAADQAAQLQRLGKQRVQPIARLALSQMRAAELMDSLDQMLKSLKARSNGS
jgi:hypothetical protein